MSKHAIATRHEWRSAGLELLKEEKELTRRSDELAWLDRAPKGRNETGVWWCRHDEYGNA